MLRKLCFLVLFLTAAGNTFSQEWTFVGNSTDGDQYYLRGMAGNSDEGTTKRWSKRVSKSMSYTKGGKKYTLVNGYCLSLYDYDCSGRQSKLVSFAYYNSKGSLVYSLQFQEYQTEWYDVLPDSIGEMLLNKVCESE
jgi:hypothetical protein